MIKRINHKALVLLISLLMIFSASFFVIPIKATPNPKPSQDVTLTIVVTSEQLDAIDGVVDDFLASEYGNGVADVDVASRLEGVAHQDVGIDLAPDHGH